MKNINSNRYYIHICRCGKIHFIENEEIFTAIEENKCVVSVCKSCGEVFAVGADYEEANPMWGIDYPHYNMWSSVIDIDFMSDFTLKSTPIYRINFSEGKKVPMKNGFIANHYSSLTDSFYMEFVNFHGKLDNFYEVDIKSLIASLTEDEYASLSKYHYSWLQVYVG